MVRFCETRSEKPTKNALSAGVARIETNAADDRSGGLGLLGDVYAAVNGPLTLRTRFRSTTATDKAFFVGFSDLVSQNLTIDEILTNASNVLTPAASDYVGIYRDHDLSDTDLQDFWLPLWRGGSAGAHPTTDALGKYPYRKHSWEDEKFYDMEVEIGRTGYISLRVNGIQLLDLADAIDPERAIRPHVLVQNREAVISDIDIDYVCLEGVRGNIPA